MTRAVCPGSRLLECAPGDAFDEIVEEDVEQYRDGQAGDERPGHQLAPVVDVAAYEVRDHAEGDRLDARTGREDQRVEERLEGDREREHPRRPESGLADRQHDPHDRLESTTAVD